MESREEKLNMREFNIGVVNAIDDNFKVRFVMHDVDMTEMSEKVFGQLDEEMIPGIGVKDCIKCKNFSKRLPLPDVLNNLRDDFLLQCLVLVFESYAQIGEPVPIELAKTYSYFMRQTKLLRTIVNPNANVRR